MPRFDVTTPNGRTIEVTAPEGATEAQAIAYAKATYSIQAPNGNTYEIEGPEGATKADIAAQILRHYPEAGRPLLKQASSKIELKDVLSALHNADAAGDVAAAKELAELARQMTQQESNALPKSMMSTTPAIGKTVAVTQAETTPAQLVSINRDVADIHAILAVTAGLAAAVLLHWIITRHLWKKPRTTPHNTGLWWGSQLASISLASVVTKLATKTIINGTTPEAWYDFGFMGTLTVPPLFLMGYVAGWIFRRIKPLAGQAVAASPNVPSAASLGAANKGIVRPVTANDDRIYATIANELENGVPDKGLWTRLFAQSGGDENQTKVLYIKQRAERLMAAEKTQVSREQEALLLQGRIKSQAATTTSHGTCPNPTCKAVIPLTSQECLNCGASFRVGSSWKINPFKA